MKKINLSSTQLGFRLTKLLLLIILTIPVYPQIVMREVVTPKAADGLYEFVCAYFAPRGDTVIIEYDRACNSLQITDDEGTMLYGIVNDIGERVAHMIEQRQKRRGKNK